MSTSSTGRTRSASADDRQRAKITMADAFNRAVDARGVSNREVGESLGVSGSRVKNYRSKDPEDLNALPSLADLLMMEPHLFERVLLELRAERLKLHGPSPVLTAEAALLRVLSADGRFQSVAAKALEDGILEPHEKREIEEADRERERAHQELRTLLRGERR